jgi:phosphate transport system permease protein
MTELPSQFSPDDADTSAALFRANLSKRHGLDRVFVALTWMATAIALVVLAALLVDVLADGLPRLNAAFLSNPPSSRPTGAGIMPALGGTIWLLGLTALISFPTGVGAGIFLEEFASDTPIARIVEINIANLAGVPSIIYGLLGLEFFVRIMQPLTGGRSVLSGALTLSLLILPIIIVSTREALRTVSDSLRQAGFALGATRWQVVREHVLPLALPGILTGTILALSRAVGETAPLIVIGAAGFIVTAPAGVTDRFTALPIQIFDWVSRPQPAFHTNAAAAIICLMVVLLLMNATAIVLRNRFQKIKV